MIDTRKALTFIFITVLVDCIGIGVIVPIMPNLIKELTHVNIGVAAEWGGWLTFAYAFMQFICSPILGGLSDRYGRRPVLLLSLLGYGLDYGFLALAPTIWWLFIGRIIAGVFGASFTTATAYIADVSPADKRAQNFGLIGAAFGLGFIIGPVMGGIFSQFGTRVPFIVAGCLSLLNFIYGYFFVPESLDKAHRRAFSWKRANPAGSLAHMKRYPAIAGLIIAMFLLYLAAQGVQSVWTFYTMEKFNWTPKMIGYSLATVGILISAVQGGLIRIAIPALGQKNAVYVGLLLQITGFILFSLATQGWMMFVFLIPYCLGGISGPALQGIMSNHVPSNEQGELQGVLTGLMSLTTIIGPLFMGYLFSFFTKHDTGYYFPGAPFVVGGVLTVVAIAVAAKSLREHHSNTAS